MITIPDSELEEKFIRSSGPGGQNVNKVSSAVELRFHIQKSPSLNDYQKNRLKQMAINQINDEGFLIIISRESRSQDENRKIVREKLSELIKRASIIPKKRKKTKPTKSSKEKRLGSKKKHGDTKKTRGKISW